MKGTKSRQKKIAEGTANLSQPAPFVSLTLLENHCFIYKSYIWSNCKSLREWWIFLVTRQKHAICVCVCACVPHSWCSHVWPGYIENKQQKPESLLRQTNMGSLRSPHRVKCVRDHSRYTLLIGPFPLFVSFQENMGHQGGRSFNKVSHTLATSHKSRPTSVTPHKIAVKFCGSTWNPNKLCGISYWTSSPPF